MNARLGRVLLPIFVAGCSGVPLEDEREAVDARQGAIFGGKPAGHHRDAVLVEVDGVRLCSGAIVAPRVVLTAAHCTGGASYEIVAPYAAWQKAYGSSAETFDGAQALWWQHDVGLVYLDTAIELDVYPSIATAPVEDGTALVSVGRKRDGELSYDELYESPEFAAASSLDWPTAYDIWHGVVEAGDSGGPTKVAGDPSRIVGVSSRWSSQQSIIARVDLVAGWVAERIAARCCPE